MKLEEFKAGMRVFATIRGAKIYGTVGNLWGKDGAEIIVRFDSGHTARVIDRNAHLFMPEPTN